MMLQHQGFTVIFVNISEGRRSSTCKTKILTDYREGVAGVSTGAGLQ